MTKTCASASQEGLQPICDSGIEMLAAEPTLKVLPDPGIPRGVEARREIRRDQVVFLQDPRPPFRLKLPEECVLRHALEDSAEHDRELPADLQGGPQADVSGGRLGRRAVAGSSPDLPVHAPGGQQSLVGAVADDAIEIQSQNPWRGHEINPPCTSVDTQRSAVRVFMNCRTIEQPNALHHFALVRNIVSSILKRPPARTAWGTLAGIRTSSPFWTVTGLPPMTRVAVPSST